MPLGGARVVVRTGGERAGADAAAPVVLVHGVIVSSRYLLALGAELARALRVVVPDLPGAGHSPASVAPSVPALADAVVAAARALGHERVALVANSFGAQVAVEAALRHPGSVARLALLGPTVDPDGRPLPRLVARWLASAPHEHPSSFALMARDVVDMGPRRAVGLARAMMTHRLEQRLGRVGCPVLVVRGAHDRVAPAGWCARVAAACGGRSVALAAGGHMAHYARAVETAAALRPFLAAADRGR